MKNIYLEELLKSVPQEPSNYWNRQSEPQFSTFNRSIFMNNRREFVKKYSWAIPNDDALNEIARSKKIVEIGAGTGYWAKLLQSRGTQVMPFDQHVKDNPYGHEVQWTPIYNGNHEVLRMMHSSFALMLCWPPYGESMAFNCLRAYKGRTVIYIGEGAYGCTGDDAFHHELDNHWNHKKSIDIPQWDGIHDYVQIYTR